MNTMRTMPPDMDAILRYLSGASRFAVNSMLALFLTSVIATSQEPAGWNSISAISAIDAISEIHITNLLLAHGIESRILGSIFHDIEVPAQNALEATRLLRKDAAKEGYFVTFDPNDEIPAGEKKERIGNLSMASVLKQPEYTKTTALGRFLRSKVVVGKTTEFPWLVSLMIHERRYLATPKTFRTGYDIELNLQKTVGNRKRNYRGDFQALDEGRKIVFLGSGQDG